MCDMWLCVVLVLPFYYVPSSRHGLYRSDQLIYNDPELIFKETVPQTALFVPNTTPGKPDAK